MDGTSPPGLRSFAEDRALLREIFREVVEGGQDDGLLALHDGTVELARSARSGDPAAQGELGSMLDGLGVKRAEELVRSLTRWFQLINLAEDNERVRRLRAREAGSPGARRGSVLAAIERLSRAGMTGSEMAGLLDEAEVRLVVTAHPTEARRRTTIEKLARIFTVLRDLDERPGPLTPAARRRLLQTVQELWGSDELRTVVPTPLDEVRASLIWFVTTLAATVPVIYRDLESALAETFPDVPLAVPSLLSFGSWIGGDRDGNPGVTPEVTGQALDLMREQCLRMIEGQMTLLAGHTSLSERIVGTPDGLDDLLAAGERLFPPLAAQMRQVNPQEPYRRAFTLIRERVRFTRTWAPEGYRRPDELLADLRTIDAALRADSGSLIAGGELQDLIRQVEVFGFHFGRLDIREHAGRHRAALAEVLSVLKVSADYVELPEAERIRLLCAEIANPRPLVPSDISGFTEETQTVLRTFRVLRGLISTRHPGAVQAYVVSGTEGASDLLEVLLLMKEAGLSRSGGRDALLRVVPLFEAEATLAGAAETMETLLGLPVYRTALEAVGSEQEIMVGYSDSNKDAGYVASGWATYRAQVELSELFVRHGLRWIFFHGRGGAVGRGGGPTNVAIGALPPGTVHGRLKMTEQGEVLAAKYAVSEIAHRELELALSATLVTAREAKSEPVPETYTDLLVRMAAESAKVYRALVHEDPRFPDFFRAVTPVDEISRLQLGSRPAKRSSDGGVEQLRAIPWVFSWTQSRIILPAWFGLGTALRLAREEVGVDALREMVEQWPFFAGLLANAEMACAKADMRIAALYVGLWDEAEPRERIWAEILTEFELTVTEILEVRGSQRLLDGSPVLQASIDRRNPYVDPLSLVQIGVLRAVRSAGGEVSEELARLSLLAINGIAGGLRNTG